MIRCGAEAGKQRRLRFFGHWSTEGLPYFLLQSSLCGWRCFLRYIAKEEDAENKAGVAWLWAHVHSEAASSASITPFHHLRNLCKKMNIEWREPFVLAGKLFVEATRSKLLCS